MSGFVGGCALNSRERESPVLCRELGLCSEKLQNGTMSPAGREGLAPVAEGKGNPLLLKVPEQETCWVSRSLILFFGRVGWGGS